MRASNTLAVLAGITAAAAQVSLPNQIFGLPFGQQCQQAVLTAATNGSIAQCLPLSSLLPLLTTQGSIIPVLDQFMTSLCYQQPCSNESLAQAASAIKTGCQADLQSGNLSPDVVDFAFNTYPTLRETLCLKTENYYTAESYGGFLGPAPIPISNAYNLTDGAFCVSSLLTQLSAYYDTNITIPFIAGAVSGSNQTARDLTTSIEANILCNECLFAAVGVVEAAYPQIANVTAGQVAGYLNLTVSDNEATLNSVMNDTCAYVPLVVSTTELPEGVTVSIVNSTFANPLEEANSTASA